MLRCFALISWEIVNEIFFLLLNEDNNLFVCHVCGGGGKEEKGEGEGWPFNILREDI